MTKLPRPANSTCHRSSVERKKLHFLKVASRFSLIYIRRSVRGKSMVENIHAQRVTDISSVHVFFFPRISFQSSFICLNFDEHTQAIKKLNDFSHTQRTATEKVFSLFFPSRLWGGKKSVKALFMTE